MTRSTSEGALEVGEMGTARCAIGLSVISAALLLLEITSTRLLSFVSWHHFAFMVVSVAMLGMGAASVALATIPRLARIGLTRLCVGGSLALAVLTVVGYVAVIRAAFSPPMLAADTVGQLVRLVATYVGLLLPYLAGGLVVASCLSRKTDRAAALYGGDLLGAGVGSLAGVVLAGPLSVEQATLASGVLAALGAAVFAGPSRALLATSLTVALALAGFCWISPTALPAMPAEGKAMALLLSDSGGPRSILVTRNTPLGRIDVVDADRPVSWSFNPRARGVEPPDQLHLLIDAEADTPVALIGPDESVDRLEYLDVLPSSLVFAVAPRGRALILGAGGGQDVLSALRNGVRRIDAVEINPATVSLMRGFLFERSGRLYARPGVHLIRAEGRSFVRASRGRYDVVQMGLVDTWAATSAGGLSLTENYLYTTDALADDLAALRPGGMVSITRWLDMPPREMVRLVVIAVEALRQRGVAEPGRHLVVVGAGRIGALLISRDAMDDELARRIVSTARERRLEVHYAPGLGGVEPGIVDRLLSDRLEDFVRRYPFDVSPVSDDRPFFFDFNTPTGWRALRLVTDLRNLALSGTGTITAVLIQAVLLSILLLIVPALSRRVRVGRAGWPLVAYFALTGTGFMFIEIPMLQRLTLVVGHPAQAAALVLAVLLGSSGLASLVSERATGGAPRRIATALATLSIVGFGLAAWGDDLGRAILEEPTWARYTLAAALVVPLGLLMGLATPHGLRAAARVRPDLVALLWAVTSFASVVGSVLSVMVSMHAGFGAALAVGAACYLGAGAVALVSRPSVAA
jgi:hypothetical protein